MNIYGIQKKIEVEMARPGEMLFFSTKQKDIKNDKQVSRLVESMREQKEDIKKTEQEIAGIQNNFEDAKEKLRDSGKNLFEMIKNGLNPSSEIMESADAQSKPSLQQKISDV